MEYTTLKHHSEPRIPSLQETQNALVHLPYDCPIKRREDADQPTSNHQKQKSGRKRERLAEAQAAPQPKPSETMRPATPPEGPSVAAIWNFILAATGSRPRRRPSYQHLLLRLLSALPRRAPSSVHKHVPWHSCKRSCILISGMIVFERTRRRM